MYFVVLKPALTVFTNLFFFMFQCVMKVLQSSVEVWSFQFLWAFGLCGGSRLQDIGTVRKGYNCMACRVGGGWLQLNVSRGNA
jgi:hypothetical protein